MPVYPEAPRKEATSFSLSDINTLLDEMSEKEKDYSLRARSSVRMVDGKQERIYVFFMRNGNESIFERLDNWWNAKSQHALVKELICTALATTDGPAGSGQTRLRTLAQEKALLRVRKMDKMAPEKIQAIFSECVAAQKEIEVFQNKIFSISSDDRLKFKEFHRGYHRLLGEGKIVSSISLLCGEKFLIKDPMNDLLAEAASHYADALLNAFMEFAQAAAGNRPMKEIDLALALAFIDRWKTLRQASRQSGTASPAVPESELAAVCRSAIDALIDVCDKLPSAPPMASQAPPGDLVALVLAPPRPVAPRPVPPLYSVSLPVLPAGLFRSLWAGAVHAASQALMPAARTMVRRAPLAAAPAALAAPAKPPARTTATTPIRPAQSPQHIPCDYQSELDMADIDREAVILIANEGGLFSLSPACREWLAELDRHQHAKEGHFSKVPYQAQTVLLARAERAPMHEYLDAAAIRRLGEVYDAAVATAVAQDRPICLTDLFDYDPRTADQCVEAMLAPVRRCYREGRQPAIYIRVTSSRLRETIVAALKMPLSAPSAEQPAVRVIDWVTAADLQLPGLMMISGDSGNPRIKALAQRHARYARPAAAGAAAMSRVVPRKLLGGNTRTHLYFLAQPCPLRNRLPDNARIASEYAALFHAARQYHCKHVTLEVLSESPGYEVILANTLSAAIMAAQALTPELKVCIVTRNKQIRDVIEGAF